MRRVWVLVAVATLMVISVAIYRSYVRQREFSEKVAYTIEHHITGILRHGGDPSKAAGSKELYDALLSVAAYSDYMDPDLAPGLVWGSLLHRNMYQVSRHVKAYQSSVSRLVFNPGQSRPSDHEKLVELVDNLKRAGWTEANVDQDRVHGFNRRAQAFMSFMGDAP